jgi:type IV pilus assembly protein PilB
MVATASADRTGEQLLRDGLINQQQLDRAIDDARAGGTSIGYSLVKLGFLEEEELVRRLSRQHRIPAIDLLRINIDRKLLKLVPAEIALKYLVLPVRRVGRSLTVAMANPTALGVVDDLKFVTRFDIEPVLAGEFSLKRIVEREYDTADDRINDLLQQFTADDVEIVEQDRDEFGLGALQVQVDEAPVVKLINGILTDAVRRGASDIHFECYERDVRLRYRIDGVLQEIMRPPLKMRAALISRFKILADLNIAERRLPQDGRIKLRVGKRVIDFRVSTLPTLFGEKIVLRILDKGNLSLDLEQFGMEPKAEEDFMRAILNPYGMVLVTGPTGSGKTTTLYSALSKISTPELNVLTAEDPIEYNLFGINQVQVRSEIGMTFAAALRAFLRQDPNIIMFGEIRDIETGSIAIKAALTGHLVLSTLHTNDAPATVNRLLNMGIEPFLVASAVNLITAQRLARRICPECKTPEEIPREALLQAGLGEAQLVDLVCYRGMGCPACNGSGYKGRVGFYQVMPMFEELREMILAGANTAELKRESMRLGVKTMRQAGLTKLSEGVTSFEEVLRCTIADD